MDFFTMKSLFFWGILLLLSVAVGCRADYEVSRLAVQRVGWDTLTVEVTFGKRVLLGDQPSIRPHALTVYLFSAAYDTLYADTSRVIPVPDTGLGDRERLMVEVCGAFETLTVCEQEAVYASPKRLRVIHDLSYPEDQAFERGSYDLQFVFERQNYDTEAWERIEQPGRVRGYLLAYVGEEEEQAVKVPFTRRRGRFSLKGRPHYKDFQYNLESMFVDQREAQVYFDVYAGVGGVLEHRLVSIEKRLRHKSPEERILEVQYFAEQAVTQILDALDVEPRRRWARAYINEWDFQPLTRTYRIELDIVWRARRGFFSRGYELNGVLDVKEDGTDSRFLRRHSNERAARLWRVRVPDDALTLGTLEPYVHSREEDLTTEGASGARRDRGLAVEN
ncbi:MAG: hypothetical protein ACE5G0_12665 [Rhodothermales bacterium]